MNDNQFKTGQMLKAIFWDEGPGQVVGQHDCESIEVVMENGQMARVPWALVKFADGRSWKYNLAAAEGVQL